MALTEGASHGSHSCGFIPPHFLEMIVNDESASQANRDSARMTLEHSHRVRQERATLPANNNNSHAATGGNSHVPRSIIPPHLLENIANDETQDPIVRSGAESTLQHSAAIRYLPKCLLLNFPY